MRELVSQIRSIVAFCGYEVEAINTHPKYIEMNLKSKSRFRKRNYHMALSNSLTGILAAEREMSRNFKKNIIIYDPTNNLPEPTFNNVELFHDLDLLQEFLTK